MTSGPPFQSSQAAARQREERRAGRPAILVAGAVGNGLFGAAAMWLAERQLGLEAFAPLAQLWTLWGLAATALVFGLQQWEIQRHALTPMAPRSPVPRRLAVGLVAISATTLVAAYVLRVQLFGDASLWWPLATGLLPAGTAATGLSYGLLARRRRYGALATLMVSENALRLAMTLVLGWFALAPKYYALSVLIGFPVALVPLLGRARGQATTPFSMGSLVALASIGFATSFTVFGGPLLAGVAGGASVVVSALFLVMIPVRVPFLLANSTLPAAIVAATDRAVGGRADSLRSTIGRLVSGSLALAALAAAMGAALGDPLAGLLFGAGGVIEPVAFALLGAAAVMCLCATFTNVIAIALGHLPETAIAWSAGILVGVVLAATGALANAIALSGWMLATAVLVLATHLSLTRSGMEAPSA